MVVEAGASTVLLWALSHSGERMTSLRQDDQEDRMSTRHHVSKANPVHPAILSKAAPKDGQFRALQCPETDSLKTKPFPIIGSNVGESRLMSYRHLLSRNHARVVVRGAAESAERGLVTNLATWATGHQTVTGLPAFKRSILSASASPREPIPVLNRMATA